MSRLLSRFALALFPALALAGCATTPVSRGPEPVTVRIVGLNDFHGNLEPRRRPMELTLPGGKKVAIPAGGGAYLATAVAQTRAKNEYSLAISAGDLVGASPLSSSYFLDEPSIGVMNRLGLDFNAVGNHEFDRGWQELKRLQEGGCEQYTIRIPCAVENPFPGATFPFLAANVVTPQGDTLFPAWGIRRFGKGEEEVAVGVIGLTLKDTPTLVTPTGVQGLTFGDEADAINKAVAALEQAGADAIVVAIHQGLNTEVGYDDKSCGGVSGDLLDILKRVDPRVDLVISGHTHRAYICDYSQIDPSRHFLVTSAGYGGAFLTDIALTIDPALDDVTKATADNIPVQSAGVDPAINSAEVDADLPSFAADPAVAAYIARYVAASDAASNRAVGKVTGDTHDPGPATEETSLGNAIADAQLAATRGAGAQIAFMNNSGIRAPLSPKADGTVTFGDIFAVQPFANSLVTRSYTGAQLMQLLEQQLNGEGFVQTFSVSQGFAFSYDMNRPAGSRIVSATLGGQPIDPGQTYRVTMNSFLAAGGDSFTVFEEGTDSTIGGIDLDAFEEWLSDVPVRALPPTGRVTDLTKK